MTVKRKKPKLKPDQHKVFVEAARELGCDESEKAFDKALGKIGKAKPPENRQSRKHG